MVLFVKHLGEALEWRLYVLALGRAYLEELEPNTLSKGCSVLRSHSCSVFKVDFVRNHHPGQRLSLVLLFDSFEPLSEQVEGVGVNDIIHQHNEVSFAQEFESSLKIFCPAMSNK